MNTINFRATLFVCGRVALACLAILGADDSSLAAEKLPIPFREAVDYDKDVKPLLKRSCYTCHGPKKQHGSFRLDKRIPAFKGGDLGPAILPHNSAESPLIRYVAGLEPELLMPPEGNRLSDTEIGILRRWIDDGAAWSKTSNDVEASPTDWWSLKPLIRPHFPLIPSNNWKKNVVDGFILARLQSSRLAPSPEADRHTLIRRLYFDLHGLPPTIAAIEAFVSDSSPDAYERLVDQLLASPRYGERWARHWLDVVHFAETHGHDQDRPRETAWPYRDYVINALNSDKPYARFLTEQIAVDALYPDQPELTPALGLLAAGPWDESTLRDIREDTLDRQIGRYLDRDDIVTTVMSTFASSTVHCARCHDHKFDPISQEDYYSLQAVFAGTERAERLYDLDPAIHARRQSLLYQKVALERKDAQAIDRLINTSLDSEIAAWEQGFRQKTIDWKVVSPVSFKAESGTELRPQTDLSLLATGPRPEYETYTVTFSTDMPAITALRLELLVDDSLPKHGPGRQDNGNLHLSEIRVFAASRSAPQTEKQLTLRNPSADFNQNGWDIAKAIDGNPQTAWGIFPEVGKPHTAVFEFEKDVTHSDGSAFRVVLEQQHGRMHTIGRLRLAVTAATKPVSVNGAPAELTQLISIPLEKRTVAERREIAIQFLKDRVTKELNTLPSAQRVYAGAQIFLPNGSQQPHVTPRDVQVLRRGEITKPIKPARPGAMERAGIAAARFSLPDPLDEAARRAALAVWLADERNPLTWRSIVNRVWHYHFGRGLVDTPNDLGRMGAQPSHPELLDWLASDFRDTGGSVKKMHRLLLNSATYRQASTHREVFAKIDADNRLLWRMNRTRLNAEAVRDSILQINQRLDLAMGGPSVKQFVMSPGIHVTPKVDYVNFDMNARGNYRRSIYRFLFRTLPDPFMDALDTPAGDQFTPVRSESVTALQAFSLLNNAFIVRQSEHLAGRLRRLARQPDEQVQAAFQETLNRNPSNDELRSFVDYAKRYGMENVCRLLFNSNEFLFVD